MLTIRLKGISKNYGWLSVIEGMDLHVEEGKPLCLLGRSGCGKSTLLKLMALITKPDKGSLLFDDKDVSRMTDAEIDRTRREKVSYAFQEPLLVPYLTALENITEVTWAPKDKAVLVLKELGLGDRLNHPPSKLSVGEKKRVDVARAILRGNPVLMADEPLSNLDPEAGEKVIGMLKAHAEGGGILVYSSVSPNEAKYAAQIVNMDKK